MCDVHWLKTQKKGDEMVTFEKYDSIESLLNNYIERFHNHFNDTIEPYKMYVEDSYDSGSLVLYIVEGRADEKNHTWIYREEDTEDRLKIPVQCWLSNTDVVRVHKEQMDFFLSGFTFHDCYWQFDDIRKEFRNDMSVKDNICELLYDACEIGDLDETIWRLKVCDFLIGFTVNHKNKHSYWPEFRSSLEFVFDPNEDLYVKSVDVDRRGVHMVTANVSFIGRVFTFKEFIDGDKIRATLDDKSMWKNEHFELKDYALRLETLTDCMWNNVQIGQLIRKEVEDKLKLRFP